LLRNSLGKLHFVLPNSKASSYTPDSASGNDDDDIVLQTFKQQQKSYRALLDGLKVSTSLRLIYGSQCSLLDESHLCDGAENSRASEWRRECSQQIRRGCGGSEAEGDIIASLMWIQNNLVPWGQILNLVVRTLLSSQVSFASFDCTTSCGVHLSLQLHLPAGGNATSG